jgi:hypothetical protein
MNVKLLTNCCKNTTQLTIMSYAYIGACFGVSNTYLGLWSV